MPSRAVVVLVGHLGNDPEQKYLATGTAVVSFSVAVSDGRKIKDEWQDHSSWYRCSLFGQRGETFAQKAAKGALVQVTGTLATDLWQPDNGAPKVQLNVNAQDVLILGDRQERQETQPWAAAPPPPKGWNEDDDDLPF